jgi:dTDP-4-dehydrorhamnose reductase
MAVNVAGTLELVRQIAAASMQVIFLSSDYVFEGTTGNYSETSPALPTTEYGRQKAVVEAEIPNITENFLILRLSKIFGLAKGDGTLLDDVAFNLLAGKKVRVARDQFFCPTYIGDVVTAMHAIQGRSLSGRLNLCSPEVWSRFGIATALGPGLGAAPDLIEPIHLHDIPAMAGRPLNTSMRCSKVLSEVDIGFTPMAACLKAVVQNYRG